MNFRVLKQIVIGVIFLLLVISVIGGVYYLVTPKPNCFDGIKNGQEEGLDCGVVCNKMCLPRVLELKITDSKIIEVQEGDYDYIFKVYNPNTVYGANHVDFEVKFLDGTNSEIAKKSDGFYVMPGQTKYVIVQAISSSGTPIKGEVKIKSGQWTTVTDFLNVSLPLRNQETLVEPGFSEFKGVIQNNSDFDFDFVEVRSVVVEQSSGAILAVSKTNLRTLLSKTEREFEASWPFVLDFSKVRVDVEADTNLMQNSNFLRRYGGSPDRFQLFY
jgi:hypothetical protein